MLLAEARPSLFTAPFTSFSAEASRPLSKRKQASPSAVANLKHGSQTARQAGPTRVGRKAAWATSAHCPPREALGLLISRESKTTLDNSGGPEGLMFLIHWLFSAPVNIVTAPPAQDSTDTENVHPHG